MGLLSSLYNFCEVSGGVFRRMSREVLQPSYLIRAVGAPHTVSDYLHTHTELAALNFQFELLMLHESEGIHHAKINKCKESLLLFLTATC